MKIYQLPDILANKIAAGEVVERPASVVKELVENSIDAGSRWVRVDIEEAGLKLIRVMDDGEGMAEEDAERAFLRHATSKIKHETDLFHVKTLGFRGEALASIASVSRLLLRTSEGEQAGTMLVLEGGVVREQKKCEARKGTEIVVEDLFFNTPARLKYMKTIHTELGHITDLLYRLALSHPEVRFEATHNGKSLFRTAGNGDLLQVIAQIYGMNIARKMIKIEAESLDFTLNGYIAKPEITRASKSYMSTLINGRYIRSIALNQAILRAYHTLLPIGRSPLAVLAIQMDPILLDVNVHPTKLEVRFSKEKELIALVEQTIRNAFRQAVLIPEVTKPQKKEAPSVQPAFQFDSPRQEMREREQAAFVKETSVIAQEPLNETMQPEIEETPDYAVETAPGAAELQATEEQPAAQHLSSERIPPMYPIGQLQGTYIMAQNENGLYMIDQHAAQERIKYEFFKEKLGKPANEVQELLLPLTFEFSGQETLYVEHHRSDLERVGLFFESFGDRTFIIRSHPVWFPKGFEEETIREMVDLVTADQLIYVEKMREAAATLMSCKRSIKANHYLTHEDMSRLLDDLRTTQDPFTCPHGRPIIVHISTYELEKMFKRVM